MAGMDERSSSFVTLTNTQPGEAIDRSVRYFCLDTDIDLSERVGTVNISDNLFQSPNISQHKNCLTNLVTLHSVV